MVTYVVKMSQKKQDCVAWSATKTICIIKRAQSLI